MEVDEKRLRKIFAQARRSMVLLSKSINGGERLTRDHRELLYVTFKEMYDLEVELGLVPVKNKKTPSGEAEWPDDNLEVWEARK